MRLLLLILICFVSFVTFSQEETEIVEEFLPIIIEGKEAFMSTKTGEYVYSFHKETNPSALITTASGVVYTDTSFHKVKKKESLFGIAKMYNLSVEEIKKYNKLKNSNLNIGQNLKIVQKLLIKSSSPVISYAGEERIIARLNPGQSLTPLNLSGNMPSVSQILKSENTNEEIIKDNKVDTFHIVKRGETLFSIAKKYETSVQELKDLNNFTLNNISIGQKLKLKQK